MSEKGFSLVDYFNLRDLNLSTDIFVTEVRARVLSGEKLVARDFVLVGKYRERFRGACAEVLSGFPHFIVDELIEFRVIFKGDVVEALRGGSAVLSEVERVETWRKTLRE